VEGEVMDSAAKLDRILETCWRQRGTDIVFAPNRRPLLRTDDGWHELQTTPLSHNDIKALAEERLSSRVDGNEGVYSYTDFRYWDVATFRAIAFGYPETTLLVISCFHAIPYKPPENTM
jgi:hypothetical protein